MTRTEHLLTIVSEECNEVSHRISKALRFGLGEKQEGQKDNNAMRILTEITELFAVLEMVADAFEPFVEEFPDEELLTQEKRVRVEAYLEYSRRLGTLTEDAS